MVNFFSFLIYTTWLDKSGFHSPHLIRRFFAGLENHYSEWLSAGHTKFPHICGQGSDMGPIWTRWCFPSIRIISLKNYACWFVAAFESCCSCMVVFESWHSGLCKIISRVLYLRHGQFSGLPLQSAFSAHILWLSEDRGSLLVARQSVHSRTCVDVGGNRVSAIVFPFSLLDWLMGFYYYLNCRPDSCWLYRIAHSLGGNCPNSSNP